MIYYDNVYRLLYGGDTLTVTIRTAQKEQMISVDFREGPEGYAFAEEGHPYTADLFPRIEEVYQEYADTLRSGDTITAVFHIKRL